MLRDFISLFYPRTCINCKRSLLSEEEYICLHCRFSLPHTNYHLLVENAMQIRMKSIHNLEHVFAYLHLNRQGIAQKIMHQVKYNNQEKLGFAVGKWFGFHIAEHAKEKHIDFIVPIPLHKQKLKERGYNQSELIANGLGEVLGLEVKNDLIKRGKYTSTQTKKGKVDRWLNVNQIFEVDSSVDLTGKHVLLLDDIITTGATVEMAATALNESGLKTLSLACIATGQK